MILPILSSLTLMCWSPQITDGDTIRCNGERVRLWGINAVERGQLGYEAASKKLGEITRTQVTCLVNNPNQPRDKYKRLVMRCYNSKGDLADQMVRSRKAEDMPEYSRGYYRR